MPSRFLTGAAAAGGIALVNSLGNISGFAAPYITGALADLSGSQRAGRNGRTTSRGGPVPETVVPGGTGPGASSVVGFAVRIVIVPGPPAGVSRSAAVVLRYLCHTGRPLDDACAELSRAVLTGIDESFLTQIARTQGVELSKQQLRAMSLVLAGHGPR